MEIAKEILSLKNKCCFKSKTNFNLYGTFHISRVIFLVTQNIVLTLTKELEEQLKVQRDKLLDLSGRNSLIDFKFKVKENARSQNYLRIVDEVPELIIDKLNVDKRFEVIRRKNLLF